MPDDSHPGFGYWPVKQPLFPFPVGSINLRASGADGAEATVHVTVPQTQPGKKTVAERSIGIKRSAKLWFALECTTDAQGLVSCEAVLRGQHVHWFPEHGETAAGPILEVRLSEAELSGWGMREQLGGHGPHCDLLLVDWAVNGAQTRCTMSVKHYEASVADLLAAREKARLEAEHNPPLDLPPDEVPIIPWPDTPIPPPPEPEPHPGDED